MNNGSWTAVPQGRWTPIEEPVKTKVSISRGGTIYVARTLLGQIGNPTYLQPLKNGSPTLLGLRAAHEGDGGMTVAVNVGSSNFGAAKVLKAFGKLPPSQQTMLPHHLDGDVVVVDLAGLPDRA